MRAGARAILRILRARRSVRALKPDPVPRELIVEVLDAARWAPSAHNAQPWRFVVITSDAVKQELATKMAEAWRQDLASDGVPEQQIKELTEASVRRFTSAPVLVLACLTMEGMHSYPDERRREAEHIMAVQSVAAAIQNMLLAAHALGLGACWFCAPLFCPDVVRSVLKLPGDLEPQALIALGFPAEEPRPPPRKPLSEVVRWERWEEGS
ncbi:MAG TPA: nitroreductase family protein [Candidatus Bathyarchaeota archaeon]|nr:nitroreductase family protein [Candidatus Bathyarchaeota archaeon]